ncbi:MAG: FAD-dependent oxidoreductase [Oscillospiraceae bacterium]|nr:FAD-dependent oxidoreductase [Oscillospiraceae bacterium]
MPSIWQNDCEMPEFPQLSGNAEADVLIIGGGLAGILAAYFLKSEGLDCIVCEGGRICGGVTGLTTAKITAQHRLIYSRIAEEFDVKTAGKYLSANLIALDKYRSFCKGIDCNFEEKDSFIYSRNDRKKLDDELHILDRLDFPAEFAKELPLPFNTVGAVRFPSQAQFHPLKFAAAIAQGLRIYENTFIGRVKGHAAYSDRGKVKARYIICTSHFPIINRYGAYFLKLYQDRSYVMALENAADYDGMYADENESGLSFRNSGKYLLLGGGGHRTGKKSCGFSELSEFAKKHYPNAKTAAKWAAQDCMTLDGIPYIGKYSPLSENLYVSTGYGKWGMTSAMISAMLLTDIITGQENEFSELFSPNRTIFRKQLFVNAAEAVCNLVTPTIPRCPHMGCALKRNPEENSWDCPCHGSRFDKNGKLRDNPAMKDANI